MKLLKYITVIIVFTICLQNCFGQESQSTLDEIMTNHIEDFKSNLKEDKADVYVIMKYDFSDYKIDKAKFIEPTLDARYLKSKTCYLVQFTLKNNKLIAVNFKVISKNRKELELINLSNGKDYDLKK